MDYPNSVIRYENTVQGSFIKRNNRFTAVACIDNSEVTVHIRNTGRLSELLLPQARIMLQRSDNPKRRTAFDLISVYKPGLQWVNIDSLAPNHLVGQVLTGMDYDIVKPEYNFGNSRIDFYMERNGQKFLTEVKGCTLAADSKNRIGLFPDAPTERGIRHLNELAEASEKGYICTIAFVIQMNDINMVFPNDKTQPEFRAALTHAVDSGVKVVYYTCHVESDSIRITDQSEDSARYKTGSGSNTYPHIIQ